MKTKKPKKAKTPHQLMRKNVSWNTGTRKHKNKKKDVKKYFEEMQKLYNK